MSRKPLKQVHRIKPANLDRQDVLRAIREAVNAVGWREFERRSELPRTTFSRWIHQNRIPPRSLERAREGLAKYRRYEPPIDQDKAILIAFLVFILGVKTYRMKRSMALDSMLGQVVRAGKVTRIIGDSRAMVARFHKAVDSKNDHAIYGPDGVEIQREYHKPTTETGRQHLASQYVNCLEWALSWIPVAIEVVAEGEELGDVVGERVLHGETSTYESFTIWNLINYCKGFPTVLSPGKFVFVYSDDEHEGHEGAYIFRLFEIRD